MDKETKKIIKKSIAEASIAVIKIAFVIAICACVAGLIFSV